MVAYANSAAANLGGKPVTDVKTAVMRIGQNAVRNIAVALALRQISHAKELEPVRVQAREVLEHGNLTEPIILAVREHESDPAELAAGSLSQILCLANRCANAPAAQSSDSAGGPALASPQRAPWTSRPRMRSWRSTLTR